MSKSLSSYFNSAVSGGSASSGSSGGIFGGNSNTTVKDASKTGFWGLVTGIFSSEKQVNVQQQGNNQATVTVKNTTGVGAYNQLMGNMPEERFKVTQVGNQVITEGVSNAGDSAWNQILGTTKKGWN
jgi:hypothetical protein